MSTTQVVCAHACPHMWPSSRKRCLTSAVLRRDTPTLPVLLIFLPRDDMLMSASAVLPCDEPHFRHFLVQYFASDKPILESRVCTRTFSMQHGHVCALIKTHTRESFFCLIGVGRRALVHPFLDALPRSLRILGCRALRHRLVALECGWPSCFGCIDISEARLSRIAGDRIVTLSWLLQRAHTEPRSRAKCCSPPAMREQLSTIGNW